MRRHLCDAIPEGRSFWRRNGVSDGESEFLLEKRSFFVTSSQTFGNCREPWRHCDIIRSFGVSFDTSEFLSESRTFLLTSTQKLVTHQSGDIIVTSYRHLEFLLETLTFCRAFGLSWVTTFVTWYNFVMSVWHNLKLKLVGDDVMSLWHHFWCHRDVDWPLTFLGWHCDIIWCWLFERLWPWEFRAGKAPQEEGLAR